MIYSFIQHRIVMENAMENSRISALQAKHTALKAKIQRELSRPLPDPLRLADLKKRKLQLKERLAGA